MQQFHIKAAAKLSGISEHTLRAWEKRYGAVVPERTDTGRRLYSQDDVARLRVLGMLTSEGHTISGIAKLSLAELEALMRLGRAGATAILAETTEIDPRRTAAELSYALARFELTALALGLTHAKANFGTRSFVLDVVAPLLQEIGDAVAEGKLTITQEHLLSALLRDQLGPFYQSLRRQESLTVSPVRMAFCTVEGDYHEFGILLAAVLAASRGAHTEYLGPNLPAAEAARAVQALRATHLVVGSLQLPPEARAVPIDDYVTELRTKLPPQLNVWLGGSSVPTTASEKNFRIVPTLEEFDRLVAEL
jgi:DNA-binding transcriptional MerR regulator